MNRKTAYHRVQTKVLLIMFCVFLSWHGTVQSQEPKKNAKKSSALAERIKFEVSVEPQEARRGTTAKLTITADLTRDDLYTYPFTIRHLSQDDWRVSSRLKFGMLEGSRIAPQIKEMKTKGIKPVWPTFKESPAPKFVIDKVADTKQWKQTKDFTLTLDIAILKDAEPGNVVLPLAVLIQVCDDKGCVPGGIQLPPAKFTVTDDPPAKLPELVKSQLKTTEYAPKIDNGDGSPAIAGRMQDSGGFLGFILAGIFWGAVSLITPCVFPMIPITVSYFLKQSEKEHHQPVVMAAVYCATIVIVLTIAAVALLSFFRELSVNPIMNIVIGGLFVFFALSLFGMYDIRLPNFMLRFTSSREGKGGYAGTVFMALTFTIISFACVAPFLGGFGGTAGTSNNTFLHRLFGGLAFSTTFAAPFFVLALFPALLKKMPQSGGWLNTVKVVMGFLELAAAFKFFRAGELVMTTVPVFFTYDFVLGLYVALSFVCGLYLLGVFRMGHDEAPESISVPRMLFSLLFLGMAIYLTPALFKFGEKGRAQRPNGAVFAWLDSFLLPEDEEDDLPWIPDLQKGLAKARLNRSLKKPGQLVFVDFTGVTCTNCKINERTVFTEPSVRELLEQYTLVALYTDKVPARFYPPEERAKYGIAKYKEDAIKNLVFQRKQFDTEELPLYVILEPTPNGYKEIGRTGGKINSTSNFISFLATPLQSESQTVPSKSVAMSAK